MVHGFDVRDSHSPDAMVGARYDPFSPLLRNSMSLSNPAATRHRQRARRAQILATIRRILAEDGCEGVSMRRLADEAGCSVQTIYNLVGPRDQAISEAISEYSLFVGRTATPRPDDPGAVIEIANRWFSAIEAHPDFCREVNLIHFTKSREIYYKFRDRQLRGMQRLLRRQKQSGIIRAEVNTKALAEHLVFLSSSMILDWADRPTPLAQLHERLCSGYSSLLAEKLDPRIAGTVQSWRSTLGQRCWGTQFGSSYVARRSA